MVNNGITKKNTSEKKIQYFMFAKSGKSDVKIEFKKQSIILQKKKK